MLNLARKFGGALKRPDVPAGVRRNFALCFSSLRGSTSVANASGQALAVVNNPSGLLFSDVWFSSRPVLTAEARKLTRRLNVPTFPPILSSQSQFSPIVLFVSASLESDSIPIHLLLRPFS